MYGAVRNDTDGHWRIDHVDSDGLLASGDLELVFQHPDEVRELIEAAEHLLTKMEGGDNGK